MSQVTKSILPFYNPNTNGILTCYSPDFTIALLRTPFLPPRFASFHVPLSFNKLDMRDYLQRLYGVDVLGVRSYIEQQKITRLRPMGRWGYGKLRRPESKKRMTVEMKQPFVWPDAPADMSPYVYFLSLVVKIEGFGELTDGIDGRRTSSSERPSTKRISRKRTVPMPAWSLTSLSVRRSRKRLSSCWKGRRPGDRLGRRWVLAMTGQRLVRGTMLRRVELGVL